jgi:hypothetical protein
MEPDELQEVGRFILGRQLAPEHCVPYYLRWIRRFQEFPRPAGATRDQDRLVAFRTELGTEQEGGVKKRAGGGRKRISNTESRITKVEGKRRRTLNVQR